VANRIQQLKKIPLYPILLSLYPPIALFAANQGQIGLDKAFTPLIFSLVIGAALYLLFILITHDHARAGVLTAISELFFFSYGHVYSLIEGDTVSGFLLGRHRFLFPFWVILLAVLLWLVLRSRNIHPGLGKILTVISLALVVLPLGQIIYRQVNAEMTVNAFTEKVDQHVENPQSLGYLPDIYYIIMDTYTRSDILLNEYQYDNSEFISFLKNNGFYIAECSKANYNQTNLSLYLSLNMNYLEDPSLLEVTSLGKGIRHNPIREILKEWGYQTVAFETGYNFTEWFDADYYFIPTSAALGTKSLLSRLSSFETMFLRSTMLATLVDANIQQAQEAEGVYRRTLTQFTYEKIKEIPDISGPKFVFIHLSTTHPPFVFDANGDPTTTALHVMKPRGGEDDYYKGYTGTLAYSDKKMQEIVTALLEKSKNPPVIILQGDHGPEKAGESKFYEILNAYYLPGNGNADLYPTISPVNSFRIILNRYFGQQLELLPDESYSAKPDKSTYMIPVECPVQ